ncbi:MAG: hypothetical protein AAFZ67_08525 [Planctomycetota bacterium]
MNTDKIDIHNYTGKLQRELKRLVTDQSLRKDHRQDIYDFVIGVRSKRSRLRRIRVSDGRCLKLIWHLRRFAMEVPVGFREIELEHMDRFVVGLENGTVQTIATAGGPRPYAGDTVTDFQKIIRQFYGWLIGESTQRYEELTGWFDTSDRAPELNAFSLNDARRMARAIGSPQGAALVMTLFDGGFRPTELFNVRLKDVEVTRDPDGEPLVWIRVRHSKTKPRKVSLAIASDEAMFWLERHPSGVEIRAGSEVVFHDPDALFIQWNYRYALRKLRDVGRQELRERVYPYRFRHASASFYATHLTEYQMCARYGWVMGSTAVRRYIDANVLLQADTAHHVRSAIATPTDQSRRSDGYTESMAGRPIQHNPHQGVQPSQGYVERTIRPTPEPHAAAVRHREYPVGTEGHL